MHQNAHLDALIAQETVTEILAHLTPKQLAVVAFRLDGLGFDDAGELLGLTRGCAYERMKAARRRLTERYPHLTTRLEAGP